MFEGQLFATVETLTGVAFALHFAKDGLSSKRYLGCLNALKKIVTGFLQFFFRLENSCERFGTRGRATYLLVEDTHVISFVSENFDIALDLHGRKRSGKVQRK